MAQNTPSGRSLASRRARSSPTEAPREHRELVGRGDLEGRVRHLGERAPRSVESVRHLADGCRAPGEQDAATSLRQQVLHGEVSAFDVVDGHRREVSVGLGVDEHDRHAGRLERLGPRLVEGERGQQHAVDALLAEEVEVCVLARRLLAAAAEEDRHAVLGGALLGAAGDLGEERVGRVEDDESDGSAASGAQLPRGVVADEAELGDGRVHAFHRRWRDLLGPVEDVRHGPHRHSRRASDVLHTDCHVTCLDGCFGPTLLFTRLNRFMKRFPDSRPGLTKE
ncbi:hypothetical protein QE428_000759 [Microbacterium sp. SORGH_AS 505]|nr:hypothetical protein [Microbacterium sp. SORGH_AS_0505]